MKKTWTLLLCLCLSIGSWAQTTMVTYAGNSGQEGFYDVVQLSDGTWLVGGYADNLNWIASSVPKTQITLPSDIKNGNGSNRYAILLQFSSDFTQMLQVVHFPQGAAENIRFIKTTNVPGTTTGDIYISGDTQDSKSNNGGYFIARLNANFVSSVPTAVTYAHPIWAEGEIKRNHPWDVGSNGQVVYVRGQTHAHDWAAMYQLDASGNRMIVEHWRTHWKTAGGEYYGDASDVSGGLSALDYSGMVLKRGNRCNFRSQTQADYDAILPDGNGSTKKGKWPLDAFFDSPCSPGSGPTSGRGYTGYKTGGTAVYGASSIAIDRRTNDVYLGMNIKSVLPSGNPDFEPAVLAFTADGELKWWSRLYHEIHPDNGNYLTSTPDQYVDALAIDYTQSATLVVNARCHGNNVENFWEGNTIAANGSANGFQNRFTGTSGNIHISWIGKLKLDDGILQHSTYVAEYPEGNTNFGSSIADPNLQNWPNPNAGWPSVNTTRLARNNMKVTADGSVCILGKGRRTITTANAHQQMPLPNNGETGTWNQFARVYQPDLSMPLYSSLLTGDWDKSTGQGGDNTELFGVWKTQQGIVVVGRHTESGGSAKGNDMPTTAVPSWGNSSANNESAILAFFTATNLENAADAPMGGVLPVEFTGFWGKREQSEAVNLHWSTASEINSDYFEIQRSEEGKVWKGLGQVNAAGNSLLPLDYAFEDVDAPSGVIYYRLKQVDLDDTFSYSSVIAVKAVDKTKELLVFPNPISNQQLMIQLSEAQQLERVEVYDFTGKLIWQQAIQQRTSSWQVQLPQAMKGTYLLKIYSDRDVWRETVVVL
ncbi:MAG: T9SS type A sorting domain-containing protein [Bacteroidota bacterium]